MKELVEKITENCNLGTYLDFVESITDTLKRRQIDMAIDNPSLVITNEWQKGFLQEDADIVYSTILSFETLLNTDTKQLAKDIYKYIYTITK